MPTNPADALAIAGTLATIVVAASTTLLLVGWGFATVIVRAIREEGDCNRGLHKALLDWAGANRDFAHERISALERRIAGVAEGRAEPAGRPGDCVPPGPMEYHIPPRLRSCRGESVADKGFPNVGESRGNL